MRNLKVFLKKRYWAVLVGIILWVTAPLAAPGFNLSQTSPAFKNAYEALRVTFIQARNIVYILSGFGLIGFAVGAIMGKINFRWLAMICIGLAVLAGADSIVGYSTSSHVPIDAGYLGVGDEDFDLDLQWDRY